MEYYYWLALAIVLQTDSYSKFKLIQKYKTPKNILNLSKEELLSNNIEEDICKNILDKSYINIVKNHLNYMKKYDIKIINIYDKIYPNILRYIYDPPIVLFLKGNVELLNENIISIVGSRNCSNYGKNVALDFSKKLSKKGIVIASGMAKGIDSYSHYGALNAKGKTIAVLGSGLDIIYPKENAKLYKQIIDNNGAVISEYILGTKPLKENFPQRNRIISGISKGVLVIEASLKSGSLITADLAIDQGRDVYVVPRQYYISIFIRYK